MILVYHKISFKKNENITIDIFSFIKQLLQLKIKGYKVVHLDEYNFQDAAQIVIRFDDGYKSVLKYALPVLKFFNFPFEVFIVENFFISAQKGNNKFLNKNDLEKIVKSKGRLQYHTKSHPDLSTIKDESKLQKEIICPDYIKALDINGFKYFAYPFWKYSPESIEIIKQHYQGACSGNGFAKDDAYLMDGIKVNKDTKIRKLQCL